MGRISDLSKTRKYVRRKDASGLACNHRENEVHQSPFLQEKLRALAAGREVARLDARAQYPTSTLAELHDPLAMPAPLLKAHQQLDRAVDRCYRPEPFPSDRHRVEYLFALYEQLTAPLVAAAKAARKGRKLQTAP